MVAWCCKYAVTDKDGKPHIVQICCEGMENCPSIPNWTIVSKLQVQVCQDCKEHIISSTVARLEPRVVEKSIME
jgi:hypothetical protein